jgi:hypothetical protein
MNRVTDWDKTFQSMPVESREIHFGRRGNDVQPVKPNENAFPHLGIDLGCAALRPQLRQGLAPERSDHKAVM